MNLFSLIPAPYRWMAYAAAAALVLAAFGTYTAYVHHRGACAACVSQPRAIVRECPPAPAEILADPLPTPLFDQMTAPSTKPPPTSRRTSPTPR